MRVPGLLLPLTLLGCHVALSETITGRIFCDNNFQFWFNGELIMTDPVEFCPHQAVDVSFEWDGVSDKNYQILCQDYMNSDYGLSGFEYVDVPFYDDDAGACCYVNQDTFEQDDCRVMDKADCPSSCVPNKGAGYWENAENSDRCTVDGCKGCGPWVGDGSLLAEFSDGTRTNRDWKVYVKSFGPTDASLENGCNYKNLKDCAVDFFDEPIGWNGVEDFDDSAWAQATEYTTEETGWGKQPYYNEETGECCGITTQSRTAADPECIAIPREQCIEPRANFCGGGEVVPGPCRTPVCYVGSGPACDRPQDPKMIWSDDLMRAQQVLFRHTVPYINDLAKLQAWCSKTSENCSMCKGRYKERRAKSVCKISAKGAGKCRNFSGSSICDMVAGCSSTKKRSRCKGGKATFTRSSA